MALEDILGTRPAGRGYTPPKSEPAKFRPINRFERSDPALKSLYEKQRAEFNARKKEEDEEYATYSKAMQARYGKDWARKVTEETAGKQRAESKESAKKAAADMRSGKTSGLVGKARDPYAGVEGPLPMYRTPEEAEAAGQTRYISPEQEQYMPAQAYVGKSEKERSAMETSGEYPEVGRFKPTEGKGVEVRKAIPQQRAFKAMLPGAPSADKVFGTKEEANAYIKEKYDERIANLQSAYTAAKESGREDAAKSFADQIRKSKSGVVASVRGTPEEIDKYQEQATSEKREGERLSKIYKQRQEEAKDRTARMREAAEDYDKATTPAEKDAARRKGEATQLDISTAQATRGMSEDQKKKFTKGMEGVLERRNAREAEVARKTESARAQSRSQQAAASEENAINNQLKFYNQQLGSLRRLYNQARSKRDEATMFEVGQAIDAWSAGVPEDPKQQRDAARRGILREKFDQLEREKRRREELSRTNPDAAR